MKYDYSIIVQLTHFVYIFETYLNIYTYIYTFLKITLFLKITHSTQMSNRKENMR